MVCMSNNPRAVTIYDSMKATPLSDNLRDQFEATGAKVTIKGENQKNSWECGYFAAFWLILVILQMKELLVVPSPPEGWTKLLQNIFLFRHLQRKVDKNLDKPSDLGVS